MWRVRVCAAHMDAFLGPKFSKQGSLFRQICLKHGWVFLKLAESVKKWVVSPKFIMEVGVGTKGAALACRRAE